VSMGVNLVRRRQTSCPETLHHGWTKPFNRIASS
jgi:hypothetical protein